MVNGEVPSISALPAAFRKRRPAGSKRPVRELRPVLLEYTAPIGGLESVPTWADPFCWDRLFLQNSPNKTTSVPLARDLAPTPRVTLVTLISRVGEWC